MKIWLMFFLAACFTATARCKPEPLKDLEREESNKKMMEQNDEGMSNIGGEGMKDEPEENKDEAMNDEFSDETMEIEDETTNEMSDEEDEEVKDETKEDQKLKNILAEEKLKDWQPKYEGDDIQTLAEEKVEKDEQLQDEEEEREDEEGEKKKRMHDEDEEKQAKDEGKRDEKLIHNDPQIGYTIRKGHIHDALEVMPPAYYMSLSIKPLYNFYDWTNVIHFTIGGKSNAIGTRIPAIFFSPQSTRIHVCTTMNNDNNYCRVSEPLPLHKYTYVYISQYPYKGKYTYRVTVAGKELANIENKIPRYYHNVKIYQSSPWYWPAPANIRYFSYNEYKYADHPIRRNTIIKHFPTYFTEYEVSFRVRPYGKINTWGSILHVTKGGNNGGHGDRIPAVWFVPNTNKLLIATSIGNNKAYSWVSKELPTNKDTRVNIKQKKVGCCRHYFTITIDDKVVLNVHNPHPRTFHNVKVYQGDPWHQAAKAYVSFVDVKTTSGGGYKLSKSKVLQFMPRVEKQWYLSFDVNHVGSTKSQWTSVLHATIGGNGGKIGYRIPGVWYVPNTRKIHICYTLQKQVNHCYNTQENPFNKYTNIQVAQIYETDTRRYLYTILVNKRVKHTVYNDKPYVFHDVKLWGSNPWENAANAFIKDLVFRNIPYK